MISITDIKPILSRMESYEIYDFLLNRFYGTNNNGVRERIDPRINDDLIPEDVIISILRDKDPELAKARRIATELCKTLLEIISQATLIHQNPPGRFYALIRIITISHPKILQDKLRSFLYAYFNIFERQNNFDTERVLWNIVQAYASYGFDMKDKDIWMKLLETRSTGAIAFNMIASIDPMSPELDGMLENLATNSKNKDWHIHIEFLRERLESSRSKML